MKPYGQISNWHSGMLQVLCELRAETVDKNNFMFFMHIHCIWINFNCSQVIFFIWQLTKVTQCSSNFFFFVCVCFEDLNYSIRELRSSFLCRLCWHAPISHLCMPNICNNHSSSSDTLEFPHICLPDLLRAQEQAIPKYWKSSRCAESRFGWTRIFSWK